MMQHTESDSDALVTHLQQTYEAGGAVFHSELTSLINPRQDQEHQDHPPLKRARREENRSITTQMISLPLCAACRNIQQH